MGTPEPGPDLPESPDLQEPGAAEEAARAALKRLPAGLRRRVEQLLARWPGRVAFRSAASCVQVEIFDRSMTIAAQFFTSVFPVLILLTTLFGGAESGGIATAIDLPEQSRSVLDEALTASGGAAFGVVGVIIVLASATSLSRALTRAYAAIWQLPRPRSSLRSAWRWVAVVLALALSLVVVGALGAFAGSVPPGNVWPRLVAFSGDLLVTVFVPWLLLSGTVPARKLLPASVLFAVVMLAVRPASALWLPRALEVSDNRYGTIGVAFTYLAWLYVVAFCVLPDGDRGSCCRHGRGMAGGVDPRRCVSGGPDGWPLTELAARAAGAARAQAHPRRGSKVRGGGPHRVLMPPEWFHPPAVPCRPVHRPQASPPPVGFPCGRRPSSAWARWSGRGSSPSSERPGRSPARQCGSRSCWPAGSPHSRATRSPVSAPATPRRAGSSSTSSGAGARGTSAA